VVAAVAFEGGEGLAEEAVGGNLVAEPESVGFQWLALGREEDAGGCLDDAGGEEALEDVARSKMGVELGQLGEHRLGEARGQGEGRREGRGHGGESW
jgi:hypothetical protein